MIDDLSILIQLAAAFVAGTVFGMEITFLWVWTVWHRVDEASLHRRFPNCGWKKTCPGRRRHPFHPEDRGGDE